jgi:hypothetical protein
MSEMGHWNAPRHLPLGSATIQPRWFELINRSMKLTVQPSNYKRQDLLGGYWVFSTQLLLLHLMLQFKIFTELGSISNRKVGNTKCHVTQNKVKWRYCTFKVEDVMTASLKYISVLANIVAPLQCSTPNRNHLWKSSVHSVKKCRTLCPMPRPPGCGRSIAHMILTQSELLAGSNWLWAKVFCIQCNVMLFTGFYVKLVEIETRVAVKARRNTYGSYQSHPWGTSREL